MNSSTIDFNMISQVLSNTLEVVKAEDMTSAALEQLQNAQSELQQAMTFSLSSIHK